MAEIDAAERKVAELTRDLENVRWYNTYLIRAGEWVCSTVLKDENGIQDYNMMLGPLSEITPSNPEIITEDGAGKFNILLHVYNTISELQAELADMTQQRDVAVAECDEMRSQLVEIRLGAAATAVIIAELSERIAQ